MHFFFLKGFALFNQKDFFIYIYKGYIFFISTVVMHITMTNEDFMEIY